MIKATSVDKRLLGLWLYCNRVLQYIFLRFLIVMEKFRYNIEQTARLLWMCGLCYNREIDNASRIIIEKEVYLDDRDGLVTTV